MFGSFWNQRGLIWEMTKRDVIGRYRGSAMGILWSFLNPILMLTVYTFVFNVVFRARWGGEDSSKIEFAIILFVGHDHPCAVRGMREQGAEPRPRATSTT